MGGTTGIMEQNASSVVARNLKRPTAAPRHNASEDGHGLLPNYGTAFRKRAGNATKLNDLSHVITLQHVLPNRIGHPKHMVAIEIGGIDNLQMPPNVRRDIAIEDKSTATNGLVENPPNLKDLPLILVEKPALNSVNISGLIECVTLIWRF